MAYRLKLKEPLVKGVRRVASEQLANAAARLQGDSDPESGVHEARKSLKRTRALLRLVRPGLGDAHFRRLNIQLRDVARQLSAARDGDVVRRLLQGLQQEAKPSVAKAARHLIAILDAAPVEPGGAASPASGFTAALKEINAIRSDVADVGLEPASFDTIVAGLVRSHKSGCKALARVLEAPSEEEPLHDLRKAAQAYWRQMILIQQAWPEACLARGAAAKHVADLLGQDHDIALLDAILAGPDGEALTAAERRALVRYCAGRHAELRGAVLPKAQLLFAERSEELGHRMRYLWEAARAAAMARVPTPAADDEVGTRESS